MDHPPPPATRTSASRLFRYAALGVRGGIVLAGAGGALVSLILFLFAAQRFHPGNFPPGVVGLAAAWGAYRYPAWVARSRRGPMRLLRWTVLGGIGLLAGGFAVFVGATWWTARAAPPPGQDAVVVLGAGLVGGDRVSLTLATRLDGAFAYAAANPRTVVVVSGGQGVDETVSEADAMADYLVRKGLAPERLLKEDRSANTRENAAFSKAVLDRHFGGRAYTAAIATQRFHLPRALRDARAAGFDAPAALPCRTPLYLVPRFYAREYAAWGWHLLRGTWRRGDGSDQSSRSWV